MITTVGRKYRVAFLVTAFGVVCTVASAVADEPARSNGRRSLKLAERNDTATTIPEMVVPAGPHYLTTAAGQSLVPVSMPADFFFEGSESTALMVEVQGTPIAGKPLRKDGFSWEFAKLVQPGESLSREDSWGKRTDVDRNWRRTAPYDTVMVQFQSAVLPDIGSQATVDLKLADVRLNSLAPIEVTGTRTVYYDVSLTIKPYHQGEGRSERMGWMTLTRDGVASGFFTSEIYGWGRLTFTPVDGGQAIIFDHDDFMTISTIQPTPFLIDSLVPSADGGIAAVNVAAYCCDMGCYTPGGEGAVHCP